MDMGKDRTLPEAIDLVSQILQCTSPLFRELMAVIWHGGPTLRMRKEQLHHFPRESVLPQQRCCRAARTVRREAIYAKVESAK